MADSDDEVEADQAATDAAAHFQNGPVLALLKAHGGRYGADL